MAVDDAGPRAVVRVAPVKSCLLDKNIAVVIKRVAQVSDCVVIGAETFIVVAVSCLVSAWNLKISSISIFMSRHTDTCYGKNRELHERFCANDVYSPTQQSGASRHLLCLSS